MQQIMLGWKGDLPPQAFTASVYASNASAYVYLNVPVGNREGTTYTAVASPGGISSSFTTTTQTDSAPFFTLTGLTNGTTYTITVYASNPLGPTTSYVAGSVTPSRYAGHSIYGIPAGIVGRKSKPYGSGPWNQHGPGFSINDNTYAASSLTPYPTYSGNWAGGGYDYTDYEYRFDVSGDTADIYQSDPLSVWAPISEVRSVVLSRATVGTSTLYVDVQIRRRYEDQAIVVPSTRITLIAEIT